MSFLTKNDELYGKNNKHCKKVKNSHERKSDSEPVYNEKYLKLK